ncbi:MAG: hypothetical protein LBL96_11840 [Clostridiales bacterium]|nr:hypothetical protein [Clostridiales bacterium]
MKILVDTDEKNMATIHIYEYMESRILYENRKIPLPEAMKRQIEANWNDQLTRNPMLFNGPLLTIVDMSIDQGVLYLRTGLTDYAHFLHTVKNRFNGERICRSVAVYALLKTSDGYYILSRQSAHTSFPGAIQCVAGAVAYEDIEFTTGSLEPRRSMRREIAEEIGLNIGENELHPKYIISRNAFCHIAFCYIITLPMDRKTVLTHFAGFVEDLRRAEKECEVAELLSVRCNLPDIARFFEDNNNTKDYLKDLMYMELGHQKPQKVDILMEDIGAD